MTKTEIIILNDKAEATKSELRSITRYLAKASDKTRMDYLRRYPKIKQSILNL